MKKILQISLLIALVLLFIGCGATKSNNDDIPTQSLLLLINSKNLLQGNHVSGNYYLSLQFNFQIINSFNESKTIYLKNDVFSYIVNDCSSNIIVDQKEIQSEAKNQYVVPANSRIDITGNKILLFTLTPSETEDQFSQPISRLETLTGISANIIVTSSQFTKSKTDITIPMETNSIWNNYDFLIESASPF